MAIVPLIPELLHLSKRDIQTVALGFDRFRVNGILYKGGDPAAPSGTATLL